MRNDFISGLSTLVGGVASTSELMTRASLTSPGREASPRCDNEHSPKSSAYAATSSELQATHRLLLGLERSVLIKSTAKISHALHRAARTAINYRFERLGFGAGRQRSSHVATALSQQEERDGQGESGTQQAVAIRAEAQTVVTRE